MSDHKALNPEDHDDRLHSSSREEGRQAEPVGLDQASTFLHALCPVPVDGQVAIFTKPDNRSHWFEASDLETAARRGVELASAADVYFTACLHDRAAAIAHKGYKRAGAEGTWVRGTAQTATGLVALWCDLDVAAGSHDGSKSLPPTDHALGVMAALPLQPSAVVWTGGGYHLWWFLREPVMLASPSERAKAHAYTTKWQDFIRYRLSPYTLDSTGDLARVLRLPGTINHKKGGSIPVRLETLDADRRYNLSDFAEHIEGLPSHSKDRKGKVTGAAPVEEIDHVPIGSRRTTMTKIGGYLRSIGFSRALIERALVGIHGAPGCLEESAADPFPEAEVQSIAKSVGQYPIGTRPDKVRLGMIDAILHAPKSIGRNERLLAVALIHHANWMSWECYPSYAGLAARTSFGNTAIWKAIANLEKHGLISTTRRFRESNVYKLLVDNILALSPTPVS